MGYSKRNPFARQVDGNHAEIKEVFEKAGFSVFDTKNVGGGFPDLILGRKGYTWLVEVKTPKGQLNEKQVKFHQDWRGCAIAIIRTVEEALTFSKSVP